MSLPSFEHLLLHGAVVVFLCLFTSGCGFFYNLDSVILEVDGSDLDSTTTPDVGSPDIATDSDSHVSDVDSDDMDTPSIPDSTPKDSGRRDADVNEPDAVMDGGSDTDADTETQDADATIDADTWHEHYCPRDFGVHEGNCHLPYQTGCRVDEFCDLRILGNPPPQPVCITKSNAGTGLEGDVCDPGNTDLGCSAGHFCLNWLKPDPRGRVCASFCLISTGEGCEADAFCTHHFPDFPDLGMCVPRCDPYDRQSCPDGQVCAADINYPTKTCHPEFRCLLNTETDEAYMSPCVPGATHSTGGCPAGQTCYSVDGENLCVRPCSTDQACAEEPADEACAESVCTGDQFCKDGACLENPHTCGSPRGEFELRYCDSIESGD
ncbi:MAG: hypothetical protein ACNA8W_07210 [Bradymonadaceae bacterium]